MKTQKGIFRLVCLNSNEKTNAVQSKISEAIILEILRKTGFFSDDHDL
jgi:hypothetical protein